MNELERRYTIIDKFCAVSIVFSFYLHQYASFIPGVTIGELLLMLSCIMIIIQRGGLVRIADTKKLIVFFSISIIFSITVLCSSTLLFNMASQAEVITRWIRYFASVLFFVIFLENTDFVELALRIYKAACIAVAIYTITQFICFVLLHVYLPVDILPFDMSREVSSDILLSYADNGNFRGYGIFAEPSYLSKFLAPQLAISLYELYDNNHSTKELIQMIVVSVAILISTSLQGFVLLVVTFAFWILFGTSMSNKKRLLGVLLIFFILFAIIAFLRMGILDRIITRINGLSSGIVDSSSKIRLYRGFAYWVEIPFSNKIIGVGMGNSGNFADTFNIITQYDYGLIRKDSLLSYMNGIASILVENGIICFAIACSFFSSLWIKIGRCGKCIFIQYILIMFSGSSLLSIFSVFYLFMIRVNVVNNEKIKDTIM